MTAGHICLNLISITSFSTKSSILTRIGFHYRISLNRVRLLTRLTRPPNSNLNSRTTLIHFSLLTPEESGLLRFVRNNRIAPSFSRHSGNHQAAHPQPKYNTYADNSGHSSYHQQTTKSHNTLSQEQAKSTPQGNPLGQIRTLSYSYITGP